MSVHSLKLLRRLGVVLLWDAYAFVAVLAYLAVGGMFGYRERLYIPILFACVIPLLAGFLIAVYHLSMSGKDAETRAKWWPRFLWAGPFAAGWYLSGLSETERDAPGRSGTGRSSPLNGSREAAD